MISIIVAAGLGGEIGADNKLLWYLKDDLINFKRLTTGKTIIMGRKTFDSLPFVLPNRKHVVLSRTKEGVAAPDVYYMRNVNFLVEAYKNSEEEIFVIGGEQIYKKFLPHADKIYITKVHHHFPQADAFFNFNMEDYTCIDLKIHEKNEKNDYDFVIYELIKK